MTYQVVLLLPVLIFLMLGGCAFFNFLNRDPNPRKLELEKERWG